MFQIRAGKWGFLARKEQTDFWNSYEKFQLSTPTRFGRPNISLGPGTIRCWTFSLSKMRLIEPGNSFLWMFETNWNIKCLFNSYIYKKSFNQAHLNALSLHLSTHPRHQSRSLRLHNPESVRITKSLLSPNISLLTPISQNI
jgi:hypothetical protein